MALWPPGAALSPPMPDMLEPSPEPGITACKHNTWSFSEGLEIAKHSVDVDLDHFINNDDTTIFGDRKLWVP